MISLNIRNARPDDAERIDHFLNQCPQEYDALGVEKKNLCRGFEPDLIVAEDKGNVVGVARLHPLEFDTTFFKTPSARLDISAIPLSARSLVSKMDYNGFTQCKIDKRMQGVPQALKGRGFFLASEDITLAMKTPRGQNKSYELCAKADVPQMMDISRAAYTFTRFHKDPNISKEAAGELQATWIKNCYHEKLADEIVILKENNRVCGYAACKVLDSIMFSGRKRLGRIVLIAVNPDMQGKGYGGALIRGCVSWFAAHKCTHIAVGTQIDNPAIGFYKKHGFKPIANTLAYHRWKTLKTLRCL
jgi:N-acetylglutamate synthase-like GNAT family acetyltransferase